MSELQTSGNYITGQVTTGTGKMNIIPRGTKTKGIILKCSINNTGVIYFGNESVTTSTGFFLDPGDVIGATIEASEDGFWVIGTQKGDTLGFLLLLG